MESEKLRIRLKFSNGVLRKTQKKDGLIHSWLLLKPHFETISDVVSYILNSFTLNHSCPHGILLYMDGFVLPEFESISILKDKDLISVKRKDTRLLDANKAIEEAKTYIEDEIVEKQPLASGVKLLASEEFKSDKDEDEALKSGLQSAPTRDITSKKRKASSKLQSPTKKRKLQAIVNTVEKKHLNDCEHIAKPKKKRKHENRSYRNALSSLDITEKCANDSKPETKSESELDENKENSMQASAVPDRAKKVSRSTLRKRTKRHLKRLNHDKAKMDELCDKEHPVKDMTIDTGSKKDMVAIDTGSKKDTVTNIIQQQHNDDSDAEGDLVPVVIRPGLIRFTSAGKVKDVEENQEANALDVHSTQNGTVEGHLASKSFSEDTHNQVAKEAYCWNGVTNKRKGQKWGQETQSNSTRKESRNGNGYSSNTWDGGSTSSWKDFRDANGYSRDQSTSTWQESSDANGQSNSKSVDNGHHLNNKSVDFDKLIPLIDLPKAGDIIAYRLLELSSSWCPELSSFRVGKITSFEPDSNRIILEPVPEYPLNLEKNNDDDGLFIGSSFYNDDGSLETDFPSLSDVRIMKLDGLTRSEGVKIPATNGISTTMRDNEAQNAKTAASNVSNQELHTPDHDAALHPLSAQNAKTVASNVSNQELHTPDHATGKKDVWEEITEVVSAKKAQLMQQDRWNKKETPAKRPWSYRGLRNSAIGPTIARLRAQNGAV